MTNRTPLLDRISGAVVLICFTVLISIIIICLLFLAGII